MKSESRRERAEFAAQLRHYSPKDPPILSTEAIDDLCATFHEDAKVRRRLKQVLAEALSVGAVSERRDLIECALKMLEAQK